MFTIIIPAYNESGILEKTVEKVRKYVRKELKENVQLIISEDGSVDGTDKIASSLAKKHRNVTHLHSKKRLGKGLAIKRCSGHLRGDVVFMMDCDLATNLNALKTGIRELRNGAKSADIIIGSRYIPGAKANRSKSRRLISQGYNFLARSMFGINISDLHCGFKGFKVPVFRQINRYTKSNGWFWDTEFIVRALETDYVVREVPVVWNEEADSKIKVFETSKEMFLELLRLKSENLKKNRGL